MSFEPNPYQSPQPAPRQDTPESPLVQATVPPPHPHIGWALLWWVGLFVSQLGVGIVVAIAIIGFHMGVMRERLPPDPEKIFDQYSVWILLGASLGTCACALLVTAIVFRGGFRRRLSLRLCSPLQLVLVLACVMPFALVAGEIANWAAEFLPMSGLEVFETVALAAWPVWFVAGCVLPAIGEEIYFRGFLSRGLIGHHGLAAGTIMTAFLFGLIHLQPVQAISAGVLGLAIQIVFVATRSLPAAMLLHLLNNLLAFLMMLAAERVPIDGVTKQDNDAPLHTPWPILVCAVVASAALLGLIWQTRTRWILPDGNEWQPGYFATEEPPAELHAEPHSDWPDLRLVALSCLAFAALVSSLVVAAR